MRMTQTLCKWLHWPWWTGTATYAFGTLVIRNRKCGVCGNLWCYTEEYGWEFKGRGRP